MNAADLTHSRQTYKLELTGSISNTDMSPAFTKTQTVNLEVTNCCAVDEMSVVTSISDYTYYINEDTEKDVWSKGTGIPKTVTWNPQWTQSVGGCPVS